MVLVESEETATVLETPDLHRKFLNVRYAECTDDEVMDISAGTGRGSLSCHCGYTWGRLVLRGKKLPENQTGPPGVKTGLCCGIAAIYMERARTFSYTDI